MPGLPVSDDVLAAERRGRGVEQENTMTDATGADRGTCWRYPARVWRLPTDWVWGVRQERVVGTAARLARDRTGGSVMRSNDVVVFENAGEIDPRQAGQLGEEMEGEPL